MNLEYQKIDTIRKKENSGYKYYGDAWATVVSIDIVGFKEIVKRLDNQDIVKIIQLFSDTVVSTARDPKFIDIFRDAYFTGDEVLVVFETSKTSKISLALEFSYYINAQINTVLSSVLVNKIPLLYSFKVGIGIWTSNDNTLVYSGQKSTSHFKATTLIGSSINYTYKLASTANRGRYPAILINSLMNTNPTKEGRVSADKWMEKYELGGGIGTIYGGNIVKTIYKK